MPTIFWQIYQEHIKNYHKSMRKINHPIKNHTHRWIHFTREGIQKNNEQMKRGPTILIIRDMQIKPQWDGTTPIQTAKTRKTDSTKFCQACGETGTFLHSGGSINWYIHFETLVIFTNSKYTWINLTDIIESGKKKAKTKGHLLYGFSYMKFKSGQN